MCFVFVLVLVPNTLTKDLKVLFANHSHLNKIRLFHLYQVKIINKNQWENPVFICQYLAQIDFLNEYCNLELLLAINSEHTFGYESTTNCLLHISIFLLIRKFLLIFLLIVNALLRCTLYFQQTVMALLSNDYNIDNRTLCYL